MMEVVPWALRLLELATDSLVQHCRYMDVGDQGYDCYTQAMTFLSSAEDELRKAISDASEREQGYPHKA